MLKRLSLSVVLVLWACSSYSESITPYYGSTNNAAANSNRWVMDNVLPSGVPGLDINGVIYNYTINKDVDDTVGVEIRNQNANGTGYIFRERDDWLPGSLGGTQINKVVPVAPTNRSLWGDGEIAVDGPGSVSDPRVVYTYKVDPCYDPQFDPNCPGYEIPRRDVDIYEVDLSTLYDPMTDVTQTVACREGDTSPECKAQQENSDEEQLSEEELAEKEKKEKEKSKDRLEKALSAADNSALFSSAIANGQLLQQMNKNVNMGTYYQKSLDGGSYRETITLDGGNLPDNRSGLRNNMAQQKLHQEMVDMQY
jgi:hypothetical protein